MSDQVETKPEICLDCDAETARACGAICFTPEGYAVSLCVPCAERWRDDDEFFERHKRRLAEVVATGEIQRYSTGRYDLNQVRAWLHSLPDVRPMEKPAPVSPLRRATPEEVARIRPACQRRRGRCFSDWRQ